jgi:hypothetical protein
VSDLVQAGSSSTMKSCCCIPASQKITWLSPTIQSVLPPLPTMLLSKDTYCPLGWKVPAMHSPHWMQSWVDGFFCRRRRSQSASRGDMETSIKCEDCNETVCFTHKQNRFYDWNLLNHAPETANGYKYLSICWLINIERWKLLNISNPLFKSPEQFRHVLNQFPNPSYVL